MPMENIFKDLLDTTDVEGVLLVSFSGDLVFKALPAKIPEHRLNGFIGPLITSMDDLNEADLIYQKKRLYIRRSNLGFIIVFMGAFAPVAMIRMNCDMLLPQLDQIKKPKKKWGFFKKNR